MPYIGQFTVPQQRNIFNAEQQRAGLVLRPTVSERGGFIRSLLASIGIPMLLQGLMGGKVLQTDSPPSHHMEGVFKSITAGNYQRPPLFYGTWSQQGSGKRKAVTKRKPARKSAITPRRKPVKRRRKDFCLNRTALSIVSQF